MCTYHIFMLKRGEMRDAGCWILDDRLQITGCSLLVKMGVLKTSSASGEPVYLWQRSSQQRPKTNANCQY